MRKLILLLLPLMMLLQGCAILGGRSGATRPIEAFPPFPPPSDAALDSLEQCRNPALDEWLIELCKLCEKLDKECSCEQNTGSTMD